MFAKYFFLRVGAQFIRSKVSILLLPLGWIWRIASFLRHCFYDLGLLRIEKVSIPVISIGNLAVGGTGKTPLVIRLAEAFSHKSVAILLRGYGKDEEFLLQRRLPKAMVYAHPDRVQSAKLAVAQGAELILLDDGFQHRKLARDLDVVIVRRSDWMGRCLPAGDLRDSPSRLKQADVLVLDTDIRVQVRRILTLKGAEVPSLKGERIGMFCGIGTPQKFKKTLLDLGADIQAEWILADHEPIGLTRLVSFCERCKTLGSRYIVCTEKDAVKLPPADLPILFLEISAEVKGFEKLMAKIEEKLYTSLIK